MISYYVEDCCSEDEYVFDFIFRTFHLKSSRSESSADADICYVVNSKNNRYPENALVVEKERSHVIWKDLLNGTLSNDPLSKELPFDIFNAIRFFLTDEGNKGLDESCYDNHQRLTYKESYQYKNDLGAIPLVNSYMIFLKALIERKFNIQLDPFYPNGKKACVILSHDVDRPDKHDILKNYSLLPRDKSLRSIWNHFRHWVSLMKFYLLDKNKNEFWNFERIIQAEKKYGFKSTSYFASTNNHVKYGDHVLDVAYSIEDRHFKPVFKAMKDSGFEIGLHASYNAFLAKEHFDLERNKLESASEAEVIGLRHHYWHLGKNPQQTLLKHEQAGFQYDSSIAFNDHLGFRYCSALPFYPYSSELNRKIEVLQIPVFCMDGNLFYNDSMTVEKAISDISEFLELIIDQQGVGAIDWHTRTSYPRGGKYNTWGQAYLQVLELLADRKEIWVTSAAEFHDWWTTRTLPSEH